VVHGPPLLPRKPALHTQSVNSSLATAAELELAGQVTHSEDPVALLYSPVTHPTQVPPSGPEYPALHTQPASAPAPSTELVRVGHARHVEARTAAEAAEYLPAAQGVQGPAPVTRLYDPGRHASHVEPASPK